MDRRLGTLPLMHQPGEQWMYNTGSDVLGVLIARASGQPLETFLRERIFEPLGMKDTGFSVPAAKLDRLATSYQTDPRPAELGSSTRPRRQPVGRPPVFPSGGGGLVSTVDDYLAFGQMMLNKGKHGRERILSRPSVELMTTDQITPEQKAVSGPSSARQPRLGVRRVRRHPARRPVGGARTLRLGRRLRHVLVCGPQGGDGRDPDDPAPLGFAPRGLSRLLDLGLPGDRRVSSHSGY